MLTASVQANMLAASSDTSATQLGSIAALAGSGQKMSASQIDKTSKDFESMFVSQMLEQMFGDSSGEAAFGSSETSDVYKGMMVDQLGKEISNAGGIGIAGYVKQELLKLQEV